MSAYNSQFNVREKMLRNWTDEPDLKRRSECVHSITRFHGEGAHLDMEAIHCAVHMTALTRFESIDVMVARRDGVKSFSQPSMRRHPRQLACMRLNLRSSIVVFGHTSSRVVVVVEILWWKALQRLWLRLDGAAS